jgi:hypothetical protein
MLATMMSRLTMGKVRRRESSSLSGMITEPSPPRY